MVWYMSVKDSWPPKHLGPASDRDSVTGRHCGQAYVNKTALQPCPTGMACSANKSHEDITALGIHLLHP